MKLLEIIANLQYNVMYIGGIKMNNNENHITEELDLLIVRFLYNYFNKIDFQNYKTNFTTPNNLK